MVGKGEVPGVGRVLDEGRLRGIVSRALGDTWRAEGCHLRAAAAGLTGFLGDHFRATLTARDSTGRTATLHLFIKSLPLTNKVKANFIDNNDYFRRETLMFRLFEELGGDDGPNPWRPKGYLYDDTILVMPDLAVDGFAPRPFLETLQLPDVLLTAASVARFHAAFANYATRKTVNPLRPYNFLEEHAEVLKEPTFCDSPFLHACARLSANLINMYSAKYKDTIQDLEPKIFQLYLEACDTLRDYDSTLNVIIHKDLWINNIMFAPGKVVLVDYQCVRYGPPAFDLLSFLYLTTSREFRETHEKEVFLHYYSMFMKSVDGSTQHRLKDIGYDEEEFLRWCEASRMFGLFFAISIFPYVLMDPGAAQRYFDDPVTYEHYCNVDRTAPVTQHGRDCRPYLDRQLVATEEFVERYLLKKVE